MSSLASEDCPRSPASDGSTSCDLNSGSSDTPGSPGSSCGMASPRPSAAAPPARPSPVPKLGLAVPRLDLGGSSAAAQPPAPQAPPAIAAPSPPPLAKPSLDLSRLRTSPEQAQPSSHLEVELLSPAFQVGAAPSTTLQSQCAGKLGVRPDRVQLFALVPVGPGEDVPAGCQRLAVQVQGSAFSLQAIEDVLAENQRLTAQLAAAASKVPAAVFSGGPNAPPLKDGDFEQLKAEVSHLRQRLTSSELLRHRGQQALQELKEEFETLHFDLLQHTDNVLSARTPRPAGLAGAAAAAAARGR